MDRSDFQPQEVSVQGEAAESMEAQALEAATFEPGELVEGTGDFRQAEVIQADLQAIFSGLQATAALQPGGGMEQGSSLPVPIPHPTDEVSAIPLPIPGPVGEVSATPITLPIPVPEEGMSNIPLPLPHPTDEVSDIPLPIPEPEEQAVLPEDSLAGGSQSIREDVFGKAPGGEEGGENITPINLPGIQNMAEVEIGNKNYNKDPGAMEIPLPGIGETGVDKNEDGGLETPLPGTVEERSDLPEPIPHPASQAGLGGDSVACDGASKDEVLPLEGDVQVTRRFTWSADSLPGEQEIGHKNEFEDLPGILPGSGAEGVGITPINLPREADLASTADQVAGSDAPEMGTGGGKTPPINLPREADLASSAGGVAGSDAPEMSGPGGGAPINLPREVDMVSSAGGVAGSGAEGVGVTPINLPREANVVTDGIEGVLDGSAVAAGGIKGPGGDGVASGAVKGPGGDGVAYDTGKGPGGDPVEIGFKFYNKEPGEAAEVPLPGTAGEGRTLYIDQDDLEPEFNSINDDAQWENLDLQNTMEDRQQIETILSNLVKSTNETAQGIIKNMKA